MKIIYIGTTIGGLLPLNEVFVEGCLAVVDLGAGQRLKFVVLPLKAFIFRESFEDGDMLSRVCEENSVFIIIYINKL